MKNVVVQILISAFFFIVISGCEKITGPKQKILGLADVRLGEKNREFFHDSSFMSFSKFGCKVTEKTSKCYSVYYMFEETGKQNRPDVPKVISILKEKYQIGYSDMQSPMESYTPVCALSDCSIGWKDLCHYDYFCDEWISWYLVFFANEKDRSIELYVSGDPELGKSSSGTLRSSASSPQKYRVLLLAYDRRLLWQNVTEKNEKLREGL